MKLVFSDSVDTDLSGRQFHVRLPVTQRTGRYADVDFKTTPSRPASRDDCLSAIYASRFVLFDKSMSTDHQMLAEGVKIMFAKAEWFDFGRMDADDIAQAGGDARPYLREGLLQPPYDCCCFRVRLVGDGPEVELLLLVNDYPSKTMGTKASAVFCFRTNGPRNEWLHLMNGISIDGTNLKAMGRPKPGDDTSVITFFEYAGLWSILNTRGVGKTTVEPGERLNRARAKAGKSPLGRVTRVDSDRYVTALRETVRMEVSGEKGDRRSPRMHLRRGHMRTFSSERFIGLRGKKKWIRAMVVGGDTERIANREAYNVKR